LKALNEKKKAQAEKEAAEQARINAKKEKEEAEAKELLEKQAKQENRESFKKPVESVKIGEDLLTKLGTEFETQEEIKAKLAAGIQDMIKKSAMMNVGNIMKSKTLVIKKSDTADPIGVDGE